MSFILDALKKSETDRQEKTAPGIADVPTAVPSRKSSKWMPVIIALLVINSVALVVVLLQSRQAPVAASAPAAASSAVVSNDTTADVGVTAARAATDARPAPVSRPVRQTPEPEAPAAASAAVTTAPEAAAPRPAATDAMRAELPADSAANEQTLLTFNDLRASGSVNLPDLHIDLHVFSEDPSGRFVFINMNQYRENATMTEGPKVRRITADGVILEYRGSSFLLPRE